MDGLCSAAIIKKYLLNTNGDSVESNLFTCECDYDREKQLKVIEEANIDEDSVIYVLDFCFDIDLMDMLIHKVKQDNLIWIDHHNTAIQKMKNYHVKGLQDPRYSATMLSWTYTNGDVDTPLVVRYIDLFDRWQKDDLSKWNNIIIPFKYALESKCLDLNDSDNCWGMLFKNDPEDIKKLILEGTIIKHYLEQKFKKEAKKKAYIIIFNQLRALCINNNSYGASVLEDLFDPEEHDIMITYSISENRKIAVGLYTSKKDINVGKIAQKYGGGGHVGAAGFLLDVSQLDVLLPKKQED